MRTLVTLILASALAALVIVSVRQRQRSALRAPDPAGSSSGADAAVWPCTAFSPENEVDGSGLTWSYRLCERGSDERRAEVRFRGGGAPHDTVELRVWLSEPLDCDAPGAVRSRVVDTPGAAGIIDSVTVPFGSYGGRIWVCARGAHGGAAWQPRSARHGDAT